MAVLAIFSHANILHVAVGDKETSQTATFPLLTDYRLVLAQVNTWLNTSEYTTLEFVVTSGHLPAPPPEGNLFHLHYEYHDFNREQVEILISQKLAEQFGCPVYLVDPSYNGEGNAWAKVTGTPEIQRNCTAKGFILKYLAREEAKKSQLDLENSQFIVCHLDAEHHLAAVKGTKLMDALTSFDEGPFGLNHSGALPFESLIDLCLSAPSKERIEQLLHQEGGLKGYLDLQNLEDLFVSDKAQTELVKEALMYQISKEIGAFAVVFSGKVDAIILSGELVRFDEALASLRKRCGFLAPIVVYSGNQGINALFAGAERIRSGESVVKLR